jgi:hypothetical protein
MIKIKKQNMNNLNNALQKPFHILSVMGSQKLIGSRTISNLLYANDYDLNEMFDVPHDENSYVKIYNHFVTMFERCLKTENYYILDFKCGAIHYLGEDIANRWTLATLKSKKKLFLESLKQDAIIKLDLCYVINGEFVEITNNYFLHELGTPNELDMSKANAKKKAIKSLQEDIEESLKEKNYYKAIKRIFACEVIENDDKVESKLLDLINSDYGRVYKVISDLKLVVRMIEQKFKPVSIELLIDNVQRIKYFASVMSGQLVIPDSTLAKLNELSKKKSALAIRRVIDDITGDLELFLNKSIYKHHKDLLS